MLTFDSLFLSSITLFVGAVKNFKHNPKVDKTMKKFSEIQINPEKVIKSEELITFRGGDGCSNFLCTCYGYGVWWGCYCSIGAMQLDISAHCGGLGGSCAEAGSCSW